MIQRKKKICKDCKTEQYLFSHGRCKKCFQSWCYSTPEGQEYLNRVCLKAKNKVRIEGKKETQEKKVELMSCDEYRKKYVQPIFNEIARLIDYGQPCIATGKFGGKLNGGHFHSVGSNRTLAFHLHNIHLQSEHSNSYKGGDNNRYREGLVREYGQKYADYVDSLKSIQPIKLSKSDLIEIKNIATVIKNELKNNPVVMTAQERIEIRDEINKRIGIYKTERKTQSSL
jgi:hypothetical protein